MNPPHLKASFIVALLVSALFLAAARAEESTSSISFTDPAKPGTLRIRVARGNVSIHGADANTLAVTTDSQPVDTAPRSDGLRVLSASSSYTLVEKNNVVTLEYGMEGWGGSSANFKIIVPRSTSVVVGGSFAGNVTCSGVSGDLDIHSLNGKVRLEGVDGGAMVETINGEITVSVKRLLAGRPLSLSSMNGSVIVRLPKEAKAAVHFRTHNGRILTDFDPEALVTKTEIARRYTRSAPSAAPSAATPSAHAGSAAPDAPASPAAPAASAVPPAPAGSVADAAPAAGSPPTADDDDWHSELRDSLREAADAAAYAAHEAAFAVHESLAAATAGMPHSLPPLPPMTGGKIVSGTLNGGGPEIQVTTMNGNITLRKL